MKNVPDYDQVCAVLADGMEFCMLGAECSANVSSWHWDVGSCIDYLLLKGSWVGCSNRAKWVLCRGELQTVGDIGNNSAFSHWVGFTKERQLLNWEG